jgi:hypothetical protein
MVAKWLPNIDVSALKASGQPIAIILITLASHFDQKGGQTIHRYHFDKAETLILIGKRSQQEKSG